MNLEENIVNQVFTEVEGGINGNLNKLTVKCFDSVNNKFSMDCDGNLVVNSITTRVKDAPQEQPISVDKIYPIGSIYLSLNATNPATLFGGTWEQISQGRTLVGVDPNDDDFKTPMKAAGEKIPYFEPQRNTAAHAHLRDATLALGSKRHYRTYEYQAG